MDHTKFHYGRDGFRENSAAIFFVIVGYDTILSYIYIYIFISVLDFPFRSRKVMKILAIAVLTFVVVAGQSLDDCLQSDSISCVQKSLYRKAKEFFDKDSLELFTGVSLVRNGRSQGRSSRSGKELMYEQEIDSANSVTDRQTALENFVSEEAGELLTGRSLRVNRFIYEFLPYFYS